jgi:hypothetical protein
MAGQFSKPFGGWDTKKPGFTLPKPAMTVPPPKPTDFPGLARIPHSEPTPIPPATGPTPARPPRGSGPSGGFPA